MRILKVSGLQVVGGNEFGFQCWSVLIAFAIKNKLK